MMAMASFRPTAPRRAAPASAQSRQGHAHVDPHLDLLLIADPRRMVRDANRISTPRFIVPGCITTQGRGALQPFGGEPL